VTQENLTSLMVLYSESTYFAIDIFQWKFTTICKTESKKKI
jgi:hypothetical protein